MKSFGVLLVLFAFLTQVSFAADSISYRLHTITDGSNLACCGTDAIDTSRDTTSGCCGAKRYDTTKNGCCQNGNDTFIASGAFTECCRLKKNGKTFWVTYDVNEKTCCWDQEELINTPTSDINICCGGDFIDVVGGSTSLCCNGKVYVPTRNTCCNSTTLVSGAEASCCLGTKSGAWKGYDPSKSTCCADGTVLSGGGSQTGCCGDKTFDPSSQGCCGKSVYNINEQGCCGGKLYNPQTSDQQCCGDRVIGGQETCCVLFKKDGGVRGVSINPDFEKCCNYSLVNPALTCCDSEVDAQSRGFNPVTEMCCNGKVNVGTAATNGCCGTKSYSLNSEICCKGKVFDVSDFIDSAFCCDSKPYDSLTEFCCGKKTNRRSDFGTPGCCGKKAYDADSDDACCRLQVYDTRKETCCGGTVAKGREATCCGTKAGKGRGDSCCGTELYNSALEVCCEGKVEEGEACCGDRGFNNVGKVCCGRTLHTLAAQPEEWSCCGDDYYNQNEQLCCKTGDDSLSSSF